MNDCSTTITDAAGLCTRKGLTLNPQSFERLLTNRLYAGFIDVPKSEYRAEEILIHS